MAASRAASIAANTGTAGHAVAFIAHATPRATAARNSPDGRAISARVRNIRAITGGSVIPTASGNAITGEAAMKTVDSSDVVPARVAVPVRRRDGERRPDQRDGHRREPQPRVAEQAGRAQRPGSPNTAITGRYGL